jgi:hypothetical protein
VRRDKSVESRGQGIKGDRIKGIKGSEYLIKINFGESSGDIFRKPTDSLHGHYERSSQGKI